MTDSFEKWFNKATGNAPYPYQIRFATDETLPDLVDVPTGMGKTAMAVLGWLWRRRWDEREAVRMAIPRRLVYCLPMRVLVEQTYENTVRWLDRLGMLAGDVEWEDQEKKQRLKSYQPSPARAELLDEAWAKKQGLTGAPIAVHLLMGGSERTDWVTWPERDAILIGTQDMLLSRALNRGYAAGRARWPMDFGLLNTDCLWVFDEVQLMSTGLVTSLQLDAWRKSLKLRGEDGFPKASCHPIVRPCQSLWMSATMARHWLDAAVDWHPYAHEAWTKRLQRRPAGNHCSRNRPYAHEAWTKRLQLGVHRLSDGTTKDDFADKRVKSLFANRKTRTEAPVAQLNAPKGKDSKPDVSGYSNKLASEILKNKAGQGLTLVIVNTVERATELYRRLHDPLKKEHIDLHLIHSRFRPLEREKWKQFLMSKDQGPRVIISTQVVEAGVDVSARVLFTELAPWASLVQRFGRCARFLGKDHQSENGTVYWMDVGTHESTALPYTLPELSEAKKQMGRTELTDVGLKQLRRLKDVLDQPTRATEAKNLFPYDPRFVPRDKDLFDLFDTTPDLTGADVDISRYIRDGRELDVQVFWREIDVDPRKRDRPDRLELCPVPFHHLREQFRGLLKSGRIWRRNYRTGWERLGIEQGELIYPGQVFLLEKSCGGYDSSLGWTGNPNDQDFELLLPQQHVAKSEKLTEKMDENDEGEDGEPLSELSGWVSLFDHSGHVCQQMDTVGKELLSESDRELSKLAARWHDRGKAHPSFEANFKPGALEGAKAGQLQGEPAAKAPDGKVQGQDERDEKKNAWRGKRRTGDMDDKRRPGFRHELASALALMETLRSRCPDHAAFKWPEGLDKHEFGDLPEPERPSGEVGPAAQELADLTREEFDLLLYLVAGHHGKVRMSLRSSPDDIVTDVPDPCPADKRQARGVRDDDRLPSCKLPGKDGQEIVAPEVTLNLDPMELGLSLRYGPSWRERTQGLLERLGPFRLAYLEALLRIADWRASREEDKQAKSPG